MSAKEQPCHVETRALIRNARRELAIIRPAPGQAALDDGAWQFPGGRAEPGESPEAALRRKCRDQLAVELDLHVGHPPFRYNAGTRTLMFRYYVAVLAHGEATPRGCTELRWALPQQLREYHFDVPTQQVIDWILKDPAR